MTPNTRLGGGGGPATSSEFHGAAPDCSGLGAVRERDSSMATSSTISPSPLGAEFFLDTRGDARSLRVRWHQSDGLVVLSLWRGGECTGSFRLAVDEVPTMIEALRAGLDAAYDDVP